MKKTIITHVDERRSAASVAGRALIRDAAVLVHEQTLQRIALPEASRLILDAAEPVVSREVRISEPRLLTRPRGWVKDLTATLAAAHMVRIDVVGRPRRFKVTGRWTNVQFAEMALQRVFLLASRLATLAYREAYHRSPDARRRHRLRGMRRRWLAEFVAFLKVAFGRAYEHLAEQYGAEALRDAVGSFDHVTLPGNALPASRKRLKAAS